MAADWEKRISEFLDAQGVRSTAQRRAIIRAAFSTTEHYTADELLVMAKKLDDSVSRATVYRTLPLLVESGLLRELDLGKPHKYYDPNYLKHPNHNHLICVDCDKIVEFEDPELEEREEMISRKLGFEPAQKNLQIRASCSKLRNSGACENKKRKKLAS